MKQTVLLSQEKQPCSVIVQHEDWQQFRGKPIVLLGAPVGRERILDPRCDSDMFWQVDPEWVKEHLPSRGHAKYFVCRHEIQAGD